MTKTRKQSAMPMAAAAMAAFGVLCSSVPAAAQAPAPSQQPTPTPSRGELLYSTHCIACHTTEMHWRDKKAATDWTSLLLQVRRWQSAASLGWREADIQEVARYLNDSMYRYPTTTGSAPERRVSRVTNATSVLTQKSNAVGA